MIEGYKKSEPLQFTSVEHDPATEKESGIFEAPGKVEIPLSQHTLWTDSVDVIYWIQGQSRRLKSFVANRVARIQRKTNPSQWRHVPGEQSPNDDATRGLDLRNLSAESRWFQGPTFVHEGETFLNICNFQCIVHLVICLPIMILYIVLFSINFVIVGVPS